MFVFVVYAVVAWYLAGKHRRTWRGFAWVGASLVTLLGVALLHWQLSVWTDGRVYLRMMQIMLYPYTAVVTAVGLYIASMPRFLAAGRCHRCRYDLAGLPVRGQVCPECGAPVLAPAVHGRCAVCRADVTWSRRRVGRCAGCQTPFRLEARPRGAPASAPGPAPARAAAARPRRARRVPALRAPTVVSRVAFLTPAASAT